MVERSRPFLTARWRNLIIVTWAVDPARLIDCVPVGTTLDSWRGKTFVSMLGFQFQDVKVLGAPIPFHQDFEEVNLRFYVRRTAGEEVRHGVVFIREMVPRPFVGGMARLLYREPYLVVPMRSTIAEGAEPRIAYEWNSAGRWQRLSASGDGPGAFVVPGSFDEFITQRNWGYNGEPGKDTLEYRVDHPRWRIWQARNTQVDCDISSICSADLARELTAPISMLIAEGSPVTIHWRNQITG